MNIYIKKIFLIFILFLFIISANKILSSSVSVRDNSDFVSSYYSKNLNDTFILSLKADIRNIADSSNVLGLYLNYDTNYINILNIKLNKDVIYYPDNTTANFIDSNSVDVTLELNKINYDNTMGVIDFSVFVKQYPSLNPVLSNFELILADIEFKSVKETNYTEIVWNKVEPRKTTFSQVGFNTLIQYDTSAIKINYKLEKPEIFFPDTEIIYTNNSLNMSVYKKSNFDDTIYFYLNNTLDKIINSQNGLFDTVNFTLTETDSYIYYCVSQDSIGSYSDSSEARVIVFDKIKPVLFSDIPDYTIIDTQPEFNIFFYDTGSFIDSLTIDIKIDSGAGDKLFYDSQINSYFIKLQPQLDIGINTVFVSISDIAGNTEVFIDTVVLVNNHAPVLIKPLPVINDRENTGTISLNLSEYSADSDVLYDSIFWKVSSSGHSIIEVLVSSDNVLSIKPIADTYGCETIVLSFTDKKDTVFCNLNICIENIPNTPAIPLIILPEKEKYFSKYENISFKWTSDSISENTDTYIIQIDTTPNFSSSFLKTFYLDTDNLIYNFDVFDNYYCRIKGVNSIINGDWSNIIKFYIDDLDSPIISNISLKDLYGLNIDISDSNFVMKANVFDSSNIRLLAFLYNLNDSSIYENTFFWNNINSGLYQKQFYFKFPLRVGDKIYYKIYCEDVRGNTSEMLGEETVLDILIDSPIFYISDNSITNQTPFTLYGKKYPGSEVTVNDNFNANTTSETEWFITLDLTSGTNIFKAVSKLGGALSDESELTLILDNIPPQINVNVPDTIYNVPYSIAIETHDSISDVTKVKYRLNGSSWINDTNISINQDGNFQIDVIAEDSSGNVSNIYTPSNKAKLDMTKPEKVTVYDEGEISADTYLEFSWNTPVDSNLIVNYFIEVSKDPDFTQILFSDWSNNNNLNFNISGESGIINSETYFCRVFAKDIAGNISDSYLSSNGIFIDTGVSVSDKPGVPLLDDYISQTNNSVYELTGKVADTITKYVFVNGSHANVDELGNWQKILILENGSNLIQIYAKGQYGTSSEKKLITVFLDNIPPEKPVFDVVSPTNKLNYYLKGQKSSDAHLILINGDTAMLITDTEWIDTITLNPETNLIQVRAKDDFNNYSDTVEKIIFLDNIAPPIPTVFYTTPYNKENQSINGTFDTQATSILRINSKPASMNFELGTWIGSVDLNNEDTNLISILAFDAAGNSSETSFVIFRDMTGPEQPKILSPVNNYKTSLYNITLSGTKPVESYVYINDILAENNDYNDTTWSTNYNMLAGFNLIRAVAKDSLGNMSEADQIVVDFDVNFFLAEIPELENTEYIYPKDFLKINLNKPINLETNNNANIYFVDISGNYDYADSLIYNSIDYSIKVIKNLLPSRSYRFIVSKNVKDENNNSLTQSLFYQFKTLIPKLTNLNIGFDNSNFTISFLNSTLLKDAFFEVTNLDLSNEKVLLADNKINFDGFKKDLGVNRKIYEVTGNYNDGETITTFAAPPVLSIKYKDLNSDGILDNTNIKSENLSIYYLNEINNVWEKIDDCDIDFSQKVVSSTISKNGIYTMFSGHFDYDTTTFVYYQNGKPKLSIYSPKNNNIYFDITELKVNDNYSLKTADDKLLSKNGFLKDMEGARILFRITPRNENDEYVQNLNDNIIIYFSWLDENNDNIVDNTVIEEKYLKLYKFDEINEVWNEIQGTIDSVNNRIFVNTNKCSIFTVFGSKFETGDFWFYPNPTLTKKINLFVAPLTDNILNLKIVNPFGRAVYSKSFNIVPGQANYIKDIDLKKLPFGGYYGKISFDGKTHITGIGIAK